MGWATSSASHVHDAGLYLEPAGGRNGHHAGAGNFICPIKSSACVLRDDVLITETGAKFMSDGLPRDAAEIEKWMASRAKNN
jgi:hypothetical protein